MGQGNDRIFNIVSLVFAVLTLLVLIWGVLRFMAPVPQVVEAPLPTAFDIPTATITLTLRPTLPPTFTPTPSNTPTLAPSETLAPSATATFTITPTNVQSATPVPTATPTITPTPNVTATVGVAAPPGATLSPLPFVLQNNAISFTSNFANSAGCQWQGLAGNVFDMNGAAFNGLRVHVYNGQEIDLYSASGTNTLYGPSGWEVAVGTTIDAGTYFVELQSQAGTVVSPVVQVTFPSDCASNLAILNFQQTRPF